MIDNDLNKRFFTEADSPVPLPPADMAWNNMHKKLDGEEPEKKKRRFIIWIPPLGCMVFAVLLTGTTVLIWWRQQRAEPVVSRQTQHPSVTNVNSSTETATTRSDVPQADKPGNNQLTATNAGKTTNNNNNNNAFKPVPTLTANDQTGNITRTKRRSPRRLLPLIKKSRPVNAITSSRGDEGTLPFAFPKQIALTDSILVKANRPLPASLFQQPPKNDSVPKKDVWVEAGLQWNAPAPMQGSDHYLTGPDGNNQVYRLLLPGIWVSVNKNRQRIVASANPYMSAPLPDKYYGQSPIPPGTGFGAVGQKKMIKMFGYQTSLQYGYRFASQCWLNGGVDATWWKKGLVYAKPVDSNFSFQPFSYPVNAKEEHEIRNFQLSANVSLSYQFKACEAVIQVSAPFSETIKKIHSPLWVRFGLRWRLAKRYVQHE